MSWLESQVSLYQTHHDFIGRPASLREVLLSSFFNNIKEIISMRKLDINHPNYDNMKKQIKLKLQGFTPSALLRVRRKVDSAIIHRTGIVQFDWDHGAIKDYDIEELKQAIYSLEFICFCGLSCSGHGFYALALIAEPELQEKYAEQCFEVFKSYGIPVDESKARNVNDLRYISYDANMLGIIEKKNLVPLKITHFRPKEQPKKNYEYKPSSFKKESNNALVNKLVNEICTAQVGHRFPTVQKVAFTLGGLGLGYHEMKSAIENTGVYSGQEDKYLKCAEVCYRDGSLKPLR